MKELLFLWIMAQPVSPYDASEPVESRAERLRVVADVIADVSGGNPGLASFLAVDAHEESGFRLDVATCQCPEKQCDNGKAHGLWQIHRAPQYPNIWANSCGTDTDSLALGARWAARYYQAQSLECSFASLGGDKVSCGVSWAKDRAKKARRLASKLSSPRNNTP